MREVTAEGKTKVEFWKSLISEARDVYASMTEEEAESCDRWMDEEYRKVEGIDGTILNVVSNKTEGEDEGICGDSKGKV